MKIYQLYQCRRCQVRWRGGMKCWNCYRTDDHDRASSVIPNSSSVEFVGGNIMRQGGK